MGPRLAASACYSFSPHMVGAHVPAAWAVASPPQILAARERAVDRMYRTLLGDLIDSPGLAKAADLAREAALAAGTAGRPLAAANADLPWPGEPHLVLWHAINVLREQRGDGHIAALQVAGLDPSRDEIEWRTDRLADAPWRALGADRAERLAELTAPLLGAAFESGLLPAQSTLGIAAVPAPAPRP